MWGGRRLESEFHKKLPPQKRIGESWEIVDRPEAQSVVAGGPLRGRTLHELWTQEREKIFGDVPETPRFPLLIKILDAQENLSLQVHPPENIATRLGGEPKSEFWYVAASNRTPSFSLDFVGRSRATALSKDFATAPLSITFTELPFKQPMPFSFQRAVFMP